LNRPSAERHGGGAGGGPASGLVTIHRLHGPDRLQVEPAPPSLGCQVLLAEDNAVNAKIAQRMLDRFGCRVESVSNGQDAVDAVRAKAFDLILMDCQMPKMDGFEATQAIRARESPQASRTPIIALTANASRSDRDRCLASGMDDHLPKPVRLIDMERVLQRWCCGGTPPAEAIDREAREP